MHFNFYLLKGLRLLLFPFSLLAGLYINCRNWLYNKKFIKTTTFNLPLICVGNLSVGGTGKSPMTEYLIRLLSQRFDVATLSRGYKRKTKGYVLAGAGTTALEIGDEPMQFHNKFPAVGVAVGESRIEAIPQILHDRPQTQIIILDDAFQHRQLQAGFNILLTEHGNPYWHDWFLPTGDLRDQKSSAARAQVIVVTKCPAGMSETDQQDCIRHMQPLPHQHVFFATIDYGVPYHLLSHQPMPLHQEQEVLLVCGIANPAPLKQYLEQKVKLYNEKRFADHHIFSIDDIHNMKEELDALHGGGKIILTTEKDAVRLVKFGNALEHLPIFVLPVKHRILFGEQQRFETLIVNYVSDFARNYQP
jgi:tetraacyldisaccharide 4'-kinase